MARQSLFQGCAWNGGGRAGRNASTCHADGPAAEVHQPVFRQLPPELAESRRQRREQLQPRLSPRGKPLAQPGRWQLRDGRWRREEGQHSGGARSSKVSSFRGCQRRARCQASADGRLEAKRRISGGGAWSCESAAARAEATQSSHEETTEERSRSYARGPSRSSSEGARPSASVDSSLGAARGERLQEGQRDQ